MLLPILGHERFGDPFLVDGLTRCASQESKGIVLTFSCCTGLKNYLCMNLMAAVGVLQPSGVLEA